MIVTIESFDTVVVIVEVPDLDRKIRRTGH
jgi:hypothetical protein